MSNGDEDPADVKRGAKGGIGRAQKLTPERRKEIAATAAAARWNADVPLAEYEGEIPFGSLVIPCAVLPDGTRVLSRRGVAKGFGLGRAGSNWQRQTESGERMPVFASAENLTPFIDDELREALMTRHLYRSKSFRGVAHGVVAAIIPKVCDMWLKARDAGALKKQQLHIAVQADMVMRGLAHVGIISLVDEATGYQDERPRKALQEILEKFIRDELGKWISRFPNEFYKHIFRLRNWEWTEQSVRKRPGVVGHWTADLVYKRLAPGVLEELRNKTPRNGKGRLKHHLHRWLTEDVGHPRLQEHLSSVITLMRVSKNWDGFMEMMDMALPVYNPQMTFKFE